MNIILLHSNLFEPSHSEMQDKQFQWISLTKSFKKRGDSIISIKSGQVLIENGKLIFLSDEWVLKKIYIEKKSEALEQYTAMRLKNAQLVPASYPFAQVALKKEVMPSGLCVSRAKQPQAYKRTSRLLERTLQLIWNKIKPTKLANYFLFTYCEKLEKGEGGRLLSRQTYCLEAGKEHGQKGFTKD